MHMAVMCDFDGFAEQARPRLQRALLSSRGVDNGAADAPAEALAYAWEHRERASAMDTPVGYLSRVGQSHTRRRGRRSAPPGAALPVPSSSRAWRVVTGRSSRPRSLPAKGRHAPYPQVT